MTHPLAITILTGFTPGAVPVPVQVPCRLLSPPTRTLGLFGDDLSVAVKREDWPPTGADTSAKGRWAITFGDTDESVSLSGYVIRSIDVLTIGVDAATPAGNPTVQELQIRFTTFPATYRDGRGGRLTEQVFNEVDSDGIPDPLDPSFRSNSALTTLALTAIGEPSSIDLGAQLDAFGPPGPLDWSNASAPMELEALLSRIGHRALLSNDALSLRVVKLPLPGDAIVIPPQLLAIAEPFELTQQPANIAQAIVITSGDTRRTVMTWRTLADMEWVWFDDAAGEWKNSAQTLTGIKPDDIAAFRSGPGQTTDERKQFSRLFTALRLKGADADEIKRFVPVPKQLTDLGGFAFGGRSAAIAARFVRATNAGQFRNDPESGSVLIPLGGVASDAEAGVFILPREATFVRMVGEGDAPNGTYTHAEALAPTDLIALFSHESNTGDFMEDYFARGFEIQADGSVLQTLEAGVPALMADPETIVVSAPFLRAVIERQPDGSSTFDLNKFELEIVARELAEIRVGVDQAQTGIVHLRGLRGDVQPGDWGGGVSRVTYDVAGRRTIVSINEHIVPDSVMSQLESRSRRSFVSGLGRFSLPGSQAARRDVSTGPTASTTGPSNSTDPVARSADRGNAKVTAEAITLAPPHEPGAAKPIGDLLAKIVSSTLIVPGRRIYLFEQVVAQDDGTIVDALNGISGDAYNVAEIENAGAFTSVPTPDGSIVHLHGSSGSDAEPYWWFTNAFSRQIFAVNLTQVGGLAGSSTVQASWTYDVFDPFDTSIPAAPIATAVDPTASPNTWARSVVGDYSKATSGLAHFDAAGLIALLWINEAPFQEAC